MDMYIMSNVYAAAGWDLGSFITNATKTVQSWGGASLTLLGIIGIIIAAYQITTGLISHGKKQVNWGVSLALLIIGGALSTSGLKLVMDIAQGGQKTIEDLGTGVNALFLLTSGWF